MARGALQRNTGWLFTWPSPRVSAGGPWLDSAVEAVEAVEAGKPSDPYLMTGYDDKTMALSHEDDGSVEIEIEVDVTGYGDWQVYRRIEVPPGEVVPHQFPEDFHAYWLRATASKEATATVQVENQQWGAPDLVPPEGRIR